jgi:hypothetical protein
MTAIRLLRPLLDIPILLPQRVKIINRTRFARQPSEVATGWKRHSRIKRKIIDLAERKNSGKI